MTELLLHFPTCLHGMMLNTLKTGTALYFYAYIPCHIFSSFSFYKYSLQMWSLPDRVQRAHNLQNQFRE
jgi:hypothetical protein